MVVGCQCIIKPSTLGNNVSERFNFILCAFVYPRVDYREDDTTMECKVVVVRVEGAVLKRNFIMIPVVLEKFAYHFKLTNKALL